MIVEFRVKNFLSVKDEQVLSFEATRDTDSQDRHCIVITPKLRVLKIAAIFGANASGKSNILKALNFMHQMVLKSATQKQVFDQTGFIPFKLSSETIDAPGLFEISFILGGVKYIYGFTLDRQAVLEEWLFSHPKGKKTRLFTRNGSAYDWGASLRGEKKRLSELTRPNSLFLSVSSQFKHELLNKVFLWFKLKLKPFVTPRTDIFNFTSLKCKEDEMFKRDVLEFLKHADFKINDILFEKIGPRERDRPGLPMEEKLLKSMRDNTGQEAMTEYSKILFKHRVAEGDAGFSNNLEFSEESMGTQRYYELAGPFVDLIGGGGVLYIDELDASLHTRLLIHLIQTFLDNSKEAQIIFTNHDLRIMTRELFRRDEIWFTQMKPDGQTELYCLSDFHPRKDKSILNGYINGAYGAVPLVRSYAMSKLERYA